jgi:hypothetical protein
MIMSCAVVPTTATVCDPLIEKLLHIEDKIVILLNSSQPTLIYDNIDDALSNAHKCFSTDFEKVPSIEL